MTSSLASNRPRPTSSNPVTSAQNRMIFARVLQGPTEHKPKIIPLFNPLDRDKPPKVTREEGIQVNLMPNFSKKEDPYALNVNHNEYSMSMEGTGSRELKRSHRISLTDYEKTLDEQFHIERVSLKNPVLDPKKQNSSDLRRISGQEPLKKPEQSSAKSSISYSSIDSQNTSFGSQLLLAGLNSVPFPKTNEPSLNSNLYQTVQRKAPTERPENTQLSVYWNRHLSNPTTGGVDFQKASKNPNQKYVPMSEKTLPPVAKNQPQGPASNDSFLLKSETASRNSNGDLPLMNLLFPEKQRQKTPKKNSQNSQVKQDPFNYIPSKHSQSLIHPTPYSTHQPPKSMSNISANQMLKTQFSKGNSNSGGNSHFESQLRSLQKNSEGSDRKREHKDIIKKYCQMFPNPLTAYEMENIVTGFCREVKLGGIEQEEFSRLFELASQMRPKQVLFEDLLPFFEILLKKVYHY